MSTISPLKYDQFEGYTETHYFPGEYRLFVNSKTYQKIRVYDNGQVWKTNEYGEYVKKKPRK